MGTICHVRDERIRCAGAGAENRVKEQSKSFFHSVRGQILKVTSLKINKINF